MLTIRSNQNPYRQYKDEGLSIVDKRGIPFENEALRNKLWADEELKESLWEEADYLCEDLYTVAPKQQVKEAFNIIKQKYFA